MRDIYEDKEKKGSSLVYKFVTILLLVIIIILLLFFNRFGKIVDREKLIPTGNVDVFDISVLCTCNGDKCIYTDLDGNVIPVFNEKTDDKLVGYVFVDDKNGNYLYQQRLQIFNNPAFEFTNKIAPGVSNVYHFVVHNSTNKTVKYRLKMIEDSEYKINMVYRLKTGDRYVIGNDSKWVTADELETDFNNLQNYKSDSYSLEWKWLYEGDDENDTIAGMNMESEYKLNIRIYFEEVNA